MCGICGIIYFNDTRQVAGEQLSAMSSLLERRGPDNSGFAIKGAAGFGHTRLSIIDLATGAQPIFNEDKSKLIIFNGEIYNFRELKEGLINKGHIFLTGSDTEVILHLYEEKGRDCVDDLQGMFAFAIYDLKERTLFAARDRLGQKPFYYYMDDEKFIFASEIKSILATGVTSEIDPCAVKAFFANQFIQAPRTIYKNIKKLRAAHTISLKRGQLKSGRYWEMPLPATDDMGLSYYKEELRSLLSESVRLRLISDVPLGAFLSGGVDSSIIAYLMKRESAGDVKTFSIGFKEKSYDERSYARKVANHLKTAHKEYEVTYDIDGFLTDVLPYFDAPFGDTSSIGTHYLCKVTRENVTVALSGDGGDELFAGYNRYLAGKLAKTYLAVPKALRKNVIENFIKMLPEGAGYYGKSVLKKLKLFIDHVNRTEANPLLVLTTPFPARELDDLLCNEFKALLDDEACRIYADEISEKYSKLDIVNHMMYTDINTYLPEDILVKVDMMSMYNSLEVRSPFLDHKLVEFISRVPLKYKLNGSRQKFILKEAFADALPGEIMKRKKQGFMTPVSSWLKDELKETARRVLFDDAASAGAGNIFDSKYIRRLFDEHCDRKIDHGLKLWFIFVYKRFEAMRQSGALIK